MNAYEALATSFEREAVSSNYDFSIKERSKKVGLAKKV